MSSNVDSLQVEVKSFSDQELREKLTELGMDVGPITGTTRSLYERKLIQLLTGSLPEFSSDLPQTPPKSPKRSSPKKSSPVPKQDNFVSDAADDFCQSSGESTINLIRARKPVSQVASEVPVSRKSIARQPTSPYPAANAQFRKPESGGSAMDHVLKFALFAIVMIVIVYFISNQEPGNSLEHKP